MSYCIECSHDCHNMCNSQTQWGGNDLENICIDANEIDRIMSMASISLTESYGIIYQGYQYYNTFPINWIATQDARTGPNYCEKCRTHGMVNGIFIGYCKDCATNVYHNKRGNGFEVKDGIITEHNNEYNERTSLLNTIYYLIKENFNDYLQEYDNDMEYY